MHPYIESTAAAYVAARTERDDAAALHIADKLLALVALAERDGVYGRVGVDDLAERQAIVGALLGVFGALVFAHWCGWLL